MIDRSNFQTEQRLAESMNLDAMTTAQALEVMNEQDARAAQAVKAVSADVAQAIDLVVAAFESGHWHGFSMLGAGTSGRLGVLDASECPPTFRTDPEMVQGIIAGGPSAMFKAVEGAEDSSEAGAAEMDARHITPSDVVMGIAAGGTTPFVHGALRGARDRGAKTIFLSCVAPFPGEPQADVTIRPIPGPEILTGSTRLKAGTATKLVLNQITTLAMVRLGKCYENLMVDLRATNQKLWDRGARIVSMLTGLERAAAMDLLRRADGQVKLAVVMHKRGVDIEQAKNLLANAKGFLRAAIGE